LSIIYGIVKSHKGHLRVRSEPGRGSAFEVCLPRTEALPEEIRTPTSPQEAPRSTKTILLVEDNLEVRKLMREILDGLGYFVLEAGHAGEAILAAENHAEPIDLMVSDIVMPGLGGLELAKRLAPTQPGMRVLYVSGYADQDTAALVLGDATVAYLAKPFGPAELARKVAEMMSRSKEPGAD
jgi:CheY-like chemotaxis protein